VTGRNSMRRRLARWLDPALAHETASIGRHAQPPLQFVPAQPHPPPPPPALEAVLNQPTIDQPVVRNPEVWPELCEQFALRILGVTYQSSTRLSDAERDEEDPGRLEQLYGFDHANARIRRQAENLLVLAGRTVEDASPQLTSLVDVVRAAASAIDHYERIQLGSIVNLAVVDVASDDVIRVVTELLDNATRYSSPSSVVTVSAHLTELGSVLLRIQDAGVGIAAEVLAEVNTRLDGRDPGGRNPTQLGLQVVEKLIRTHSMRVQLTRREGGGTTASVLLNEALLGEVPIIEEPPAAPIELPRRAAAHHLSLVTEPRPTRQPLPPPPPPPVPVPAGLNALPRREPGSIRDMPAHPPDLRSHPPSDRAAWPDETMDFDAGFESAFEAPLSSEGRT
jgi:hypothetical protein